MTRRLPLLDCIDIPSPCTAGWDAMHGDDVTRFCEQCSRDVHDLSALTRRQAEGLVRRSGGKLCVRMTRDADGRTLTAAPSVVRTNHHVRQMVEAPPLPAWVANPVILQRASRAAASALAVALLATTPVLTHAQSATSALAAENSGPASGTGSVSGAVTDSQGTRVAGATVTLRGPQGVSTSSSGLDGQFRFDSVPSGSYNLTVESAGFAPFEASTFVITAGEAEVFTAELSTTSDIVVTSGGISMSFTSKAHCHVWKVNADDEAEPEEETEPAPEPPLLSAIDLGEDELREALDAGAGANERFDFGRTPLMHAADDEDLVRLLLEHGADPGLRDEGGATALHYAALSDEAGTVFALCKAGADPDVADLDGVTPLILAAWDGNEDTVTALIAAGASVHARDAKGRSALDFAREAENDEIIVILEVAGAK